MIQKRKLQIRKKPEKLSFYLECYHEQHQQLKRKFPGFFPSIFEFLPRCHKTRVHPFAHDFPAISEGSRLQDFSIINCLGTHLTCTGAHWTAKTIWGFRRGCVHSPIDDNLLAVLLERNRPFTVDETTGKIIHVAMVGLVSQNSFF